jgi:hypothetical protein
VDVGIDHVEARGIVTREGRLHELDMIVLATGFEAHAYMKPLELVGSGGLRLSELWDGEPFGYRSVALAGFPNIFTLLGPHSPIGNRRSSQSPRQVVGAFDCERHPGASSAFRPACVLRSFRTARRERLELGEPPLGCGVGGDARPDSRRGNPEAGLANHTLDGRADRVRRRPRSQADTGAAVNDARRDVELVAPHRDADERNSVGQCAGHGAHAGVRDDDRRFGEQLGVRRAADDRCVVPGVE